jgi:hypothetical protein
MEVSGQLHTPATLPPEKNYPFDRRLGGPQNHSGCGGEGENTQLPPGLITNKMVKK